MRYVFDTSKRNVKETFIELDRVGNAIRIKTTGDRCSQDHYLRIEEVSKLVLALVDMKLELENSDFSNITWRE